MFVFINSGQRKNGHFHFGEKNQTKLFSFKCLYWWSFLDGSQLLVKNRVNLKFGQNRLINVAFGIELLGFYRIEMRFSEWSKYLEIQDRGIKECQVHHISIRYGLSF